MSPGQSLEAPGLPSVADDVVRDPVAVFLADPGSHLGDVLYLYFRSYKRNVILRLFTRAIDAVGRGPRGTLRVADVGASMGFDLKYVFNVLTAGFTTPLPCPVDVSLVEGDEQLIAHGEAEWQVTTRVPAMQYRYVRADLASGLPLPDGSQDIVLCSEVVEHLERPMQLLGEIHRALSPGGQLILTTDNCPSVLQRLRRIPVWLSGAYRRAYTRPRPAETITGRVTTTSAPIYGHINLNPTCYWEQLAAAAGFELVSFGTYESMRRGGGRKTPGVLAFYFTAGFLVSLLPRRIGRFFGDTTVLALRKPGPR